MHVLPTPSTRSSLFAWPHGDVARSIASGLLLSLVVAVWVMWPSGARPSGPSLLLLVVAPTLEEIVFRGGLQEGLLRRVGESRAGLANLLTGAAFAIAHVVVRPTLASLLTLLPALAIGAVYQRRRRIAPCIVLHVVFNGMWLLWVGLSVPI